MLEGIIADIPIPQGRFFVAARKALGLSRAELARHAGISASTLADFETGKRKITRHNFAAICRALHDEGIQFAVTDDAIVGLRWPV
jgi:transcriptional regulator with XRE-family HTH domain